MLFGNRFQVRRSGWRVTIGASGNFFYDLITDFNNPQCVHVPKSWRRRCAHNGAPCIMQGITANNKGRQGAWEKNVARGNIGRRRQLLQMFHFGPTSGNGRVLSPHPVMSIHTIHAFPLYITQTIRFNVIWSNSSFSRYSLRQNIFI